MSKKTPYLWLLGLLLASAWYVQQGQEPILPPGVSHPATPQLTRILPDHLSYAEIIKQLDTWQDEAPGLAVRGTYATSARHAPLCYLRVGNLKVVGRPEVLITGAIHGNEPLSTSVVLGVIGKLLSGYGTDPALTEILDTRDIYFIPVVSPDSYPSSRYVDGVDPNRDFDNTHSPTIAALKTFYQQHHFRAAISGHTYGRVFLFAPGNTTTPTPDDAAFKDLFGRMASLAGYDAKHACELYGRPIHGSEVDHYYNTSHAVACVMEMGTASQGGQRPARPEEIKAELERTWPAFVFFLKEAPVLLSP